MVNAKSHQFESFLFVIVSCTYITLTLNMEKENSIRINYRKKFLVGRRGREMLRKHYTYQLKTIDLIS